MNPTSDWKDVGNIINTTSKILAKEGVLHFLLTIFVQPFPRKISI